MRSGPCLRPADNRWKPGWARRINARAAMVIFFATLALALVSATFSGSQPLALARSTWHALRDSGEAYWQAHYRSPAVFIPRAATQSLPVYPLKLSPNGRYLLDQDNVPFLLVGDAPQSMIGNLSETDAKTYLADRQAVGFNAVWVNLLCNNYTGCRSDGATFDGIPPFTTAGDLSTPNEVYFTRADHMIQAAAQHGIVVFLDPIETGGWLATLQSNGLTKATSYGVYLGNRYKNFPNIVWMSGNDFQTWSNAGDDALVTAVVNGIKSVDANHLHTAELNYNVSTTLDDPHWASLAGLNAAYTYFPTYAEVLHAYNQAVVPTFLVEEHYELENVGGEAGTPNVLRRQEYWTLLSGATGQLYGNHYTWTFAPGWQNNLDTPGVAQLSYVTSLFASRAWYSLVPDQTHVIVTAGYGTFSTTGNVSANDYLTAARTPDGSLVIAYMPTVRTITADLSQLTGPVTAQWYDPTNGAYTPVSDSPFSNTGMRQFTPPGSNSSGDGDWVLVLQASYPSPTATATATPTPTHTTTATPTPSPTGFDASQGTQTFFPFILHRSLTSGFSSNMGGSLVHSDSLYP